MFAFSIEGCNAADVTGCGWEEGWYGCVHVCEWACVQWRSKVRFLKPESLGLNHSSIVFGKLLNLFVSQFLHL